MSDIELRDHSQPCEHGTTFCHTLDSGDWQKTPGSSTTIRTMNDGWCPGGKKIVMRREWRCLQGEAYGGPCRDEGWTIVVGTSTKDIWASYPMRHRECGYVWVEVSDE